jgi:hypothetical protein
MRICRAILLGVLYLGKIYIMTLIYIYMINYQTIPNHCTQFAHYHHELRPCSYIIHIFRSFIRLR